MTGAFRRKEKSRHRHIEKEGHVKTQKLEGHLQAKGRGLRRNQPHIYLELRLLTYRNKFLMFKSLALEEFIYYYYNFFYQNKE